MSVRIIAAAIIAAVALPAYADCNADLEKIYQTFEDRSMTEEQIAPLNDLLDEAEAYINDGNEEACLEVVSEINQKLSQ